MFTTIKVVKIWVIYSSFHYNITNRFLFLYMYILKRKRATWASKSGILIRIAKPKVKGRSTFNLNIILPLNTFVCRNTLTNKMRERKFFTYVFGKIFHNGLFTKSCVQCDFIRYKLIINYFHNKDHFYSINALQ